MRLLYAATLFVSAALLFLVQPLLARMVLPMLGGAPAVWNTCMVFFQAALLAGYAYAHAAPARLGVRRHAVLHLGLLVAVLFLSGVQLTTVGILGRYMARVHAEVLARPLYLVDTVERSDPSPASGKPANTRDAAPLSR